jgi:hypothetical protein
MEDALRMFNNKPSQNVVTWNVLGKMCHERTKVKKFLNIFNMCEKGVQPIIYFLFAFYQFVAMQVW